MHVVHQVELPIELAVQCLAACGACCKALPAVFGQGARIAGKIEQPLCTRSRGSGGKDAAQRSTAKGLPTLDLLLEKGALLGGYHHATHPTAQ
eukprot:6491520-Amphidinium_carterae.3